MQNEANSPTDTFTESFTEPTADRAPTTSEERAAEQAASHVDVEKVAEHAEEMNEIGKNVAGEGQIEPSI